MPSRQPARRTIHGSGTRLPTAWRWPRIWKLDSEITPPGRAERCGRCTAELRGHRWGRSASGVPQHLDVSAL
jgi:hypothetical protein